MKKTLLLSFLFLLAACAKSSLPPERAELSIQGMTCENCVNGITGSMNAVPGIEQIAVDLESASATVQFDPGAITAGQIAERITRMGFQASVRPTAE